METEFIPLGPCPTCHQPRWRELICECSHGVSGHDIGKRQGKPIRTACSSSGCGCKFYVVADG